MTQYTVEKIRTEGFGTCAGDSSITQGRILWLPAKGDLPERAVRRAHGKGAIEEGIYNHPIVVISRPREENYLIHFHLITSLQGKRLDQLYSKSNEFHTNRRSWYLPIAPTPTHPDAVSKKSKKRFPTLELADNATLRWDSYVNIRHVYKIRLSSLRPYSNPETPDIKVYAFKQESTIRMLAKGKYLTMYDPGSQFVRCLRPNRSTSEPVYMSPNRKCTSSKDEQGSRSPKSDAGSITSNGNIKPAPAHSVDFCMVIIDGDRIAGPPPKVPPDSEKQSTSILFVLDCIIRPFDQFLENAQSMSVNANERPMELKVDPNFITQPLNRFWRDMKGATAVVIASI